METGFSMSLRKLYDRFRPEADDRATPAPGHALPGHAVAVVGFYSDEGEQHRLQRTFDTFTYAHKRLYLFDGERERELYDISNSLHEELVACIHPDYDYPASYLGDMVSACGDPHADVVWTNEPSYPVGTFVEVANPDIYASIIPAHVLRLFYSRSNRHIRPENRSSRTKAVRTFNCAVGTVEKHALPNPLRTKNAIYGLLDYAFRMNRRCIESYLRLKGLGREGLDVDYDEFLRSLTPVQHRHLVFFLNTNAAGERAYECVSQHLALDARQAVLDIGSGYGGLVKAFARRGHPTTGLEILHRVMDLAELNLRGYNVRLVVGDFLADEPKLAGYDLLTMTDVIEHLADVDQGIAKMVAILSEGGHAYVKVPNSRFVDYVREDSHTGLFGITLLRHDDAHAYLRAARGMAYSVGEYYDYQYYIRIFEEYGATLVTVENIQKPLEEAAQLIAGCEAALEKWESEMALPAAMKANLRRRAQEYLVEFRRGYKSRPDQVFVRDYMTSHWNMFFRKGTART